MHVASAVLLCALFIACGSKDPTPGPELHDQPTTPAAKRDRWPEVEEIARGAHAGGSSAELGAAIAKLGRDGSVPDESLDRAIAWNHSAGVLPTQDMFDGVATSIHLYRISRALLQRRGADPDAVRTTLSLGAQLRQDGRDLVAVAAGIQIAADVRRLHASERPSQDEARLAPTRAEVLRGLAANAIWLLSIDTPPPRDYQETRAIVEEFVLDAPADRIAFMQRLHEANERSTSAGTKNSFGSASVEAEVAQMLDRVDAYQEWISK